MQEQVVGCLNLSCHVSETVAHCLVFHDDLAECFPLLGVIARAFECRSRDAGRLGCNADPTGCQILERDPIALPLFAKHHVRWDL